MELRGGPMKPATGWLSLPESIVHGPIDDLVEGWCGTVGQLPLSDLGLIARTAQSEILIPLFQIYLRSIDHRNLLSGVKLTDSADAGWRVLDLESLVDYLLISAFFDFTQPNSVILEIGGGFGRLIEFLMRIHERSFRYINIDAVPVSMMYCYQYLKAHFPERTVKMFDRDAAGDGRDCDVLIVPAWDLDILQLDPVDLAINIESMQEMNQTLVDFYIRYLDNIVRENGLICLTNSREHEFIGRWTFPDVWQCLFKHR